MDYTEAIAYLYASRPPFHLIGGAAYKPGLETTMRLMDHVGNPHTRFPSVHVAGTNGKGSTSHLIAASLQAAGLKVGLYTSPHLLSLNERIRINGVPISQERIAAFITTHRSFLDEVQPSFFETMTMMAFDYFASESVDIAVVEVGLGGRLDSTNVITPVLSVITNIGLDHTEYLGNTLSRIAREKAGIMKPGVACVIGETHPRTMNIFLERARECGILGEGPETTDCRIWFADQCGYLRRRRLREAPECELEGLYQEQNLQTAYVALQVLLNYSPFSSHLSPSSFKSALRTGFAHVCALTGLRGRWETIAREPLTICDTGHNSHGLQYVARQLKALTAPRVWVVFGMVNDKDSELSLSLMPADERFRYIFTSPNTHRARTGAEMLSIWASVHPEAASRAQVIEPAAEALRHARTQADKDDVIFVGGSNYLVGEALQ